MNLIAGHGRVYAAQELGMETVPCVFIEGLTDEQRRAYILADNRIGEMAEWDKQLISIELEDLSLDGFNIDVTGFNIDDILIEQEEEEHETREVEKTERKIDITRGDIFILGEHRLMCGDATSADDVAKLMNGTVADLLLTDPPYMVSLGQNEGRPLRPSEMKQLHKRTDGKIIQNDDLSETEFVDFLRSALGNAENALKRGGAFYIFHSDQHGLLFRQISAEVGLVPREVLVWVKNTFALGRQDYQWRHEPILYGWTEGAGHYFIDMRSLTTVYDITDDMSREEAIETLKEICSISSTLYADKPTRSELHPTMKPVDLLRKLVRNSTQENEIVLDLFGGSGSTLIACEQQRRKCYTMEIDPIYCEAIINRWEQLTGEEAKRYA